MALGGALRAKKMRFFSESELYGALRSGRMTRGKGLEFEISSYRGRAPRRRLLLHEICMYTYIHREIYIRIYMYARTDVQPRTRDVLIKIFLDRRREFWILRKVT